MYCKECKGSFKEGAYYKVIPGLCKNCVVKKADYKNKMKFIEFCKEYNIVFVANLYKNHKSKDVKDYIKIISSLPQYRGLGFESSTFYSEKDDMYSAGLNDFKDKKDFNTNVVEFLKEEEQMLQEKARRCLENHDFAMYNKLITAYSNVVSLIKQYDWKLMYSEYETRDSSKNEEFHKQVTVWEKNGDGQIRNHKIWNVTFDSYGSRTQPK